MGTKIGRAERWDRYVGKDAGWEVAMRGQPADFYAEELTREVTGMRAACIGKPATC